MTGFTPYRPAATFAFALRVCFATAALTASLTAASDARAECGLIPPPFELSDQPLLERIGAVRPVPEKGMVTLPVMTHDCPEAGENAYADMEIVDGGPVRIKISRLLTGKREIDEFEAFARKYLGDTPKERKEQRAEDDGYKGVYAFWDKGSYDAVFQITPEENTTGTFQGVILMTTRGTAAQKQSRYERLEAGTDNTKKGGRKGDQGAFGESGNPQAAPGY